MAIPDFSPPERIALVDVVAGKLEGTVERAKRAPAVLRKILLKLIDDCEFRTARPAPAAQNIPRRRQFPPQIWSTEKVTCRDQRSALTFALPTPLSDLSAASTHG
jgi:hypothetical protein